MQYVHGIFRRSTYPGPERIFNGLNPNFVVRKRLIMSPILKVHVLFSVPSDSTDGGSLTLAMLEGRQHSSLGSCSVCIVGLKW